MDYTGYVTAAAQRYGVRPDLALRLMGQESAGNPGAVSHKGARGLMQLMPETARELGVDPNDPLQNIDGGVRYLKQQLDAFGDERLALAAYNAGPGAVRKHGGIPPFAETQNYVRKIMGGQPNGSGGAASASGSSDDIFGFGAPAGAIWASWPAGGASAAAGSSDDIFGFAPDPSGGGQSIPKADAIDEAFLSGDPQIRMPEPAGRGPKIDRDLYDQLAGLGLDDEGIRKTAGIDQATFDQAYGSAATPEAKSLGDQIRGIMAPTWERKGREALAAKDFLHTGLGSDRSAEVLDAVTLGFGDELLGLDAAGTAMRKHLIGALTGKKPEYSVADAYRATQQGVDAQRRAYEEERPGEALAIQLGGAFLPGVGGAKFVAKGSTMGGRMGRSAAVGAGYGGVSGFGHGEGGVGERLATAGGGAVMGAALGAALPPVLEGAAATLGKAFQAGRSPATKAARAQEKAGDRVAEVLQRAIVRDLENPTAAAARLRADTATPTFQQLGPNTAAVAEVLAQAPGPGQKIIVDAVKGFQAREATAVKSDIGRALEGRGDYLDAIDGVMARRKAEAMPHRNAAFGDQMDPGDFDAFVAPILPRVPKSAMKFAEDIARTDGRNPEELGLIAMASDPPAIVGAAAKPDPFFEKAFGIVRNSRTGRDSRGDSLLDFVSKRGGLNEPGELGHMDAQLWHRAKPFMRKLIKDNGDSADGMAMRAWEAGYFPNLYERPTPRDLFDAIRKELSGQKIYAREADSQEADLAAYADALERRLGEAGIDPGALSAKDAWKRLFDYEAENASLQDLAELGTASRAPQIDIGYEARPTLETLHYVKKGLDQQLEAFRNPVSGKLDLEGNPAGASLSKVRSDLGKAMRRISPDYDQFMAKWGEESDHLAALRLGHDALKPSVNSAQLRRRIADMSKIERENFRKGVGESLLDAARSKGGVNAMRQLLRNEEIADKVKLAFPSQSAFDDFMAAAKRRVEAQERNNQIVGNSRTFGRQAAAADLAEQPTGALDMAGGVLDVASANPLTLTGKALKQVVKRLPRQDRSIVGDTSLNALLARAMENPETAAALIEGLVRRQAQEQASLGRQTQGLIAAPAAVLLGDRSASSRRSVP